MSDDFRTPVSEGERALMADCLNFVLKRFPGHGVAILVFEFGDNPDRAMHWGSNAQRQDMLKALQEFMQKQAS